MQTDIIMTKMPSNWRTHKKNRGKSGIIMPALQSLPVGMQIEVANYDTAKQYKSLLKKEFPDRQFDYYEINNIYYIGRIA
jgi:hypothetical protein